MGKSIRITAIIAFALQIVYVLVGRIIIPFISGIIYSNKSLSYSNEPVKMLLIAMGMYFGVVLIGMIIPLLYLAFMIMLIAASKSYKNGIALEIIGLIVMGFLLPVASMIVSGLALPLISRLITTWASIDAYVIYTTMNTSGAFLSVLSTVALVLLIMSFSFSICRKKWARDDEFDRGTEA